MKDKDKKNSERRPLTLHEKWELDSLAYEEYYKGCRIEGAIPVHYSEDVLKEDPESSKDESH